MITYSYGFLWTFGALFEHAADVRGRPWTNIIEPWVRIPPPPLTLSIGSNPCFDGSSRMSLTVHMTAEPGKVLCFLSPFAFVETHVAVHLPRARGCFHSIHCRAYSRYLWV